MGKAKPLTDVRALPKWQKYAIIAILFLLAASFTISGAMIAVFDYMSRSDNPPVIKIADEEVRSADFLKYVYFFQFLLGFFSTNSSRTSFVKNLAFNSF